MWVFWLTLAPRMNVTLARLYTLTFGPIMLRGAMESFEGKTTEALGKMTTLLGSGISAPKSRRSRARNP
jgi:hypothetical protein